MNIFTFSASVVNILFKLVSAHGVSVLEFFLWRNVFNLIAISAYVKVNNVDVVKSVSKRQLMWIVARAVVGNTCFAVINYSLILNQLSLHMILF